MSISRFQRMVGIAEDEYEHLKSLQRSNNPLQEKFLSLSNEYQQQGFIHDPYVRVQRQGETLTQMINIKDELRKRVIEATPKPYQSRVQSLFHFISDKIGVNARGEIYDKDGAVLQGSNISDLVQHAVRDRRRNMTPVGWKVFLNILQDNNALRMILNYETLDEMQAVQKPKKIAIRPTRSDTSRRRDSSLARAKHVRSSLHVKERSSKRVKKEPAYFNPRKIKDEKKYI